MVPTYIGEQHLSRRTVGCQSQITREFIHATSSTTEVTMKIALILSTLLLVAASARGNPVPDQSSQEDNNDKLVLSKENVFGNEYIKYRGEHTVTNLLVAIAGNIYGDDDDTTAEFTVFFNQVDIKPNGEKVELGQYVLVNNTAHKIFDGRDSTSDLGSADVYFGAKDGLYVYNKNNKSADKFGTITDSIVQLQITNGTHEIYILTEPDYRIYKVNRDGTTKTLVEAIPSAKQFVLDRKNNIYYYGDNKLPYVLVAGSSQPVQFSLVSDVKDPTLVRPAFMIPEGVPFVVDRHVYYLAPNGSAMITPFQFKDMPTAISVDAGILHYYALDGNIYELNFIEILVKALFGAVSEFVNELKDKVSSYISPSSNEV